MTHGVINGKKDLTMNILKPSYKIVRSTPDMLSVIAEAARTCYLSEPKHHTEFERDDFISRLIKMGHQTPFEFADIEMEFICNRGVSHEAVRHRLASPMQESTRYCNYSKDGKHGMNVIDPMFFDREEARRLIMIPGATEKVLINKFDVWFDCMKHAEWGYETLLAMGAKPQEARDVLPNALKTKLKIKANVREWWHIFNMRASNAAAHPQIREIMMPALEECKERWPILFSHI